MRSRLSRSYASNLPSSFSIVLSSALVCSTSPPVSVSGTIHLLALFPGRRQKPGQSSKPRQHLAFVTSSGPRTIHLVPIGYGPGPVSPPLSAYRHHSLASHAVPSAIRRYRRNSASEPGRRPAPATISAHTDLEARRNCSATPPNCSTSGQDRLARFTSSDTAY